MDQIKLNTNEAILYLILAGVAVGFVLGLIPLILGLIKKKQKYAIYGFFATLVAGALQSVLALIVAAIFVWLILRKPQQANANMNAVETVSTNADSNSFDRDAS